MSQLEERTEERLENQKREVRAKEDNEIRYRYGTLICSSLRSNNVNRAERRAMEQAAIHSSRQYQLQRSRNIKAKEQHEAEVLAKEWVHRNIEVELSMAAEEADRKREANELASHIKAQSEARKKLEMVLGNCMT